MTFDWSHYFDLAVKLRGQAGSSEHSDACLRSSISRAYYATFHKSRQYLEAKWGVTIPKSSSAHWVILSELRSKGQHSIARTLNRMHIDRKKADYDDNVENLKSTVQATINRANHINSLLSNS